MVRCDLCSFLIIKLQIALDHACDAMLLVVRYNNVILRVVLVQFLQFGKYPYLRL